MIRQLFSPSESGRLLRLKYSLCVLAVVCGIIGSATGFWFVASAVLAVIVCILGALGAIAVIAASVVGTVAAGIGNNNILAMTDSWRQGLGEWVWQSLGSLLPHIAVPALPYLGSGFLLYLLIECISHISLKLTEAKELQSA